MRKFHASFYYLLAGVLLAGYIYFFERGPVKKKEEEGKKNKVLASFVADDIREIQVEDLANTVTARRQPIVMKKDDKDAWRIVSPQDLRADESTLRSVLTGVGDMTADTVVENPASLRDFGLDPPQGRCVLVDKAGHRFELQVGAKGLEGSSVYVTTPERKTVYLVGTFAADNLHKEIDYYRDHSFFKTDSVLATKVRVTRSGKTFLFVKSKENTWEMTQPMIAKADGTKVRDLLNTINGLRIDSFVTDHPAGLGVYGLSSPYARIEVWNEGSKEPHEILLGKKKEKASGIYAKLASEPSVCLVGEYLDRSMDLKLDDYRDKSFLQFDAASATSLTIRKGMTTYLYQKDAKGLWTCSGRPNADKEASTLIGLLAGTAVLEFADKGAVTGVDHPGFIAEVGFKDGVTHVFKFGNRQGGKVHLSVPGSRDVYRVSDQVVNDLEDYYNSILTPVTPAKPAPGQ